MRLFTVSLFTLLLCSGAMAQEKKDTLYFMNGEFLTVQVLDTANFLVHCKYMKKNKEKETSLERERLFGIKFGNGTERIYYYYDTMVGNYFTVEETKKFVYGEHDAIIGYKPRIDFVGGVLVGAASFIVSPTIIAPFPVFIYTGCVTLIPRIKGNRKKVSNFDYIKDPSYLTGYERVARKKKIFYSLAGGVVGLSLGFAVDVFILKDKLQ